MITFKQNSATVVFERATMTENETTTMIWTSENITNETISPNGTAIPQTPPFYLKFRDEIWVIPLLCVCVINIAAILIFEIYVLYKSCGERRHLFMGQVLLLALFLASLLGLLYIPEPHWLFCGITRAGLGLAYGLIFAILFVKCIFLLKLHNGVYFNASFQALLLFFVVAVEIAIVTQWLVYSPPRTQIAAPDSGNPGEMCVDAPLDRIVYLSYVMFLMLLVIIASIRARSLRENNRESMYIGISIGISLVFWVAWVSVALIFDRRYDAPAEAFGLVCTVTVVFLLIFIPKAVQLGSRKGDLFNGSTAGSHSAIHTPCFLHLQPHAVLPSSTQGTLVKQSNLSAADYCRNYPSRLWHYDYPSFRQMETPSSDYHSLKKLNGSASQNQAF